MQSQISPDLCAVLKVFEAQLVTEAYLISTLSLNTGLQNTQFLKQAIALNPW